MDQSLFGYFWGYWPCLRAVHHSGQLLHRAHGRSGGDHAIREVSEGRRAGIELEEADLRFRGKHH